MLILHLLFSHILHLVPQKSAFGDMGTYGPHEKDCIFCVPVGFPQRKALTGICVVEGVRHRHSFPLKALLAWL